MKDNLLDLIDDTLVEYKEAADEFIEENIKPIADYIKAQRKKQLEKEYEEVLKLEGGI